MRLCGTVKRGCSPDVPTAKAPRHKGDDGDIRPRLKVSGDILKVVPPNFIDACTFVLHGTISMQIS
jgi:hypothetical protein